MSDDERLVLTTLATLGMYIWIDQDRQALRTSQRPPDDVLAELTRLRAQLLATLRRTDDPLVLHHRLARGLELLRIQEIRGVTQTDEYLSLLGGWEQMLAEYERLVPSS